MKRMLIFLWLALLFLAIGGCGCLGPDVPCLPCL